MPFGEKLLLYAVTDRSWVGRNTLLEQAEAALKGGVTCLQLREKDLDEEAFLAEAMEMKALCQRYGVPLIINDRADVAIKCGADGVHVGQEDMKLSDVRKLLGEERIIGVSAHTVQEALEAEKAGADYLGVGAVFGSSTKKNAHSIDHETVREICAAVRIPVVAIGGIDRNNVQKLKGTGVDGVALISAIFAAGDMERIEAECRYLKEIARQVRHL